MNSLVSTPECSFTDILPAEIRNEIYKFALSHENPLRRLPSGRRSAFPKRCDNTAVLFVNKLIHKEAIKIFYDVNTINVPRSKFCSGNVDAITSPCDVQLIKHILISCFDVSHHCAERRDPGQKCRSCDTSASGVCDLLANLPRLRSVLIKSKYEPSRGDLKPTADVAELALFAKEVDEGRGPLRLVFEDVGMCRIEGALRSEVTVQLEEYGIAEAWQNLVALSPEEREDLLGLKILISTEDEYDTLRRILFSEWPQGIQQEIRKLKAGQLEAFFHQTSRLLVLYKSLEVISSVRPLWTSSLCAPDLVETVA